LQRNFQIEAHACPAAALDRPVVWGRAFAGVGVGRILALATWLAGMGKGAQIIAVAALHHRPANIHPFPEGNLNR
jgi:hypothetical protein